MTAITRFAGGTDFSRFGRVDAQVRDDYLRAIPNAKRVGSGVTMAGTYDTSEARDVLGRVAGAHLNFGSAKQAAGTACLSQLEELVKEIDPNQNALDSLRHQHNVLEIGTIGGTCVRYAVRGDGIAVKPESGESSLLRLSYNAALDILEGPAEPTTPGQPMRRRSALAVLVEAAADVLGRPSEA